MLSPSFAFALDIPCLRHHADVGAYCWEVAHGICRERIHTAAKGEAFVPALPHPPTFRPNQLERDAFEARVAAMQARQRQDNLVSAVVRSRQRGRR